MNIIKSLILIIFFICAYLTTTKLPVFGGTFGKLFTLLKDVALMVAVLSFIIIKVENPRIRVDKINIVLILYLCSLVFYTAISPLGKSAVLGFLGFSTAPILFFLLYNIQISNETIFKILRITYFYALFHLIIGLIIHLFFLDNFFNVMGVHQYMENSGLGIKNLYRFKNFEYVPRLVGLSIQPNEIGSLCIFQLLFTSIVIKNKLGKILVYAIVIVTLYLTTARSPILGFIGAVAFLQWVKLNSIVLKNLLLIGFIISLVGAIYLAMAHLDTVLSYLDMSAVVHLMHILVEGPEAMIKYWYGLGIGMAGGLVMRLNTSDMGLDGMWFESDHIMMIIQIGALGFILYLSSISLIIKKIFIKKYHNFNNQIFNERTIMFFLAILIGGITFPLFASSRLISYIGWAFLAFSIQIARKEEIDLKHHE